MNVIDEYLSNVDAINRAELERVRQIIRQSIPDAEEVMTYGMPGFKYHGKYLVSYGAFANHMSIFPGADAIEQLKPKLDKFKTSKGTVQFTLDNPLPAKTISQLVMARKKDIA